ncbi:MAG: MerC domain-containing protein [Lentisphaeraceae bacterium]|nr:MerC domain-containing protein [Lentisphaeraceae bacterium]
MKKILDIDCLGMCASVLCLIHCLCLPWLVAIAGVYFGSFFESPNFHNIMLVVAILIGLPVFILSFKRYRSKLILFTGIVGLSLTTLGTMKSDSCCPPVSTEEVCEETGDCSSECKEEAQCENEQVQDSKSSGVNTLLSFNTVPLGVSFLIFAHFLNFRKRKSCKNVCCS